jgi:PAS domain S-box-containing protein
MNNSLVDQPAIPMLPANEPERLAALHRYQILDTPAEVAFDRLTALAARLFKMPTVLISLVDESRAWFKSSIGFSATEVLRDATICSFAVLTNKPLIVPDTRLDDRFACNPFVQCEPGMRFYAGAPLIDRDGFNLGTLCLLDSAPHDPLTVEQEATLVDLAAVVVDELELRLAAQQIASVEAALVEITQGVARVTGGAFFDELVKHFAKVLGTDYVYIGLVEGTEPKMMRTIATCDRGNIVENLEYLLQNTPCWEAVEQRKICCYPRNVKAQFPNALLLQSLSIESYIAIPFYGSDGNVLGLLGVMDGKPLEHVYLAESLLTIFASRIATELERQQYELMLVEQTRLLEAVSTGQPLDECLSALCSSIAILSPHTRACVLLTDDCRMKFARSITPDFAPSLSQGLKDAPINDLAIGTCGTAVYCGQPVTCSDIDNDERWSAGWRDLCIAHGIRACHSVPIMGIDNLPLGSVMLCFNEARLPTNWEYRLGEFGTKIASIAIERLRSIEKLAKSENRLQMALLGAQQGTWDWDVKNQILTWDARYKEMSGLPPDVEPSYARFLESLHPDDRQRIDEAVAIALDGHVEFSEEYRAIHADNTVRWILSRGRGFYNADGEAYRMSGTVKDITDRRQAEAILRESEERFRQMADSAPMLVWMAGTDKLCYYFNQPWLDFTGRTIEQELGNGWAEGVHPEDFQTCLETYINAFNARLPFEMDYRLRRFDGEYRWILDAGQPRFTLQGEFLGYIGSCIDITDRVQAVNALRESERKFSAIFDQTFEFIGLLSIDGILQEVNQSALDSIAAQKIDIVGKYFWDTPWWTHSRELQEQLRENINLAASGQFIRYEVTFPSGSGSLMVTTFSLKPVIDEIDQVVMLIAEGYDITDRKQAEAALRKSEERYRTLFESIDEGFCIIEVLFDENDASQDYRFLEVNHVFEEQTGLEHAVGKTMRQLVPDIEEHWIATYGQVVLTGEAARFENYTEAMDRWFEVYACQTGQPEDRQVAIVFKDISDRKRFEKALQASEEKSRNILESITDAFFALDRDWRYTYLNSQVERLVNRTPSELLGKVIWEEFPGLIGSEFEIAYYRAANEQIDSSVTAFYPDHERWYELRVYPAIDGITVYFKDVTDLKSIESEREQLLQREQIAREAAETANRIKDEFLATLSHELRAPLNPILGWAQLLQVRKFDDTKLAEALAIIERSAKLQAQLIDDLLDIAKILRGKLTMESASVDLVFVIESALDTVRSAVVTKSIQIHQELPQICHVSGDSARLQQVIWNLLSNAVKFTPKHGRIHLRLEQVGDQAQITVSDTGKGIDPTFLPYIFESFRQEDATTTRKYGGLGLGLTIVRTLVEAHGGTISAESEGEAKGATFTVHLPLLETDKEAEPPKLLEKQEPQLTGVRVLVVDDDLDNCELLTVVLSHYGVEVMCVASAADALECLDSFVPDVLVSDIGMPDMDGYIFLQTLRSLPPEKGGQIPAIALTAYAREQDIQRAIESGFHGHVSKPINIDQFVQAVEALARTD